jgi:predicted naringenin-chalcone synthase
VALNVALAMEERYRNILIVAFEAPSTLQNIKTTAVDAWQGNCTFGDGAAAVWVSNSDHPQGLGLAIEKLRNWQHSETGLDLIHSRYDDYYGFAMRDEKTFDEDVKQFVTGALSETENEWRDEPRWAIHPAGIVLLTRISRKLGIPRDALQASVDNYRANSNMSSVSILHILKAVAEETPPGAAVNLLTMGAGFNVIYGKVRRST